MSPAFIGALVVTGIVAVLALSEANKKALPSGSVLLLGDSLSVGNGSLGGQLAKLLEESGRSVTKNALGARSAYSFWHGTGVPGHREPAKGALQLQEAIDGGARTAIILLGTNDLAGLAKLKGENLEATLKPFRLLVHQLREAGVDVYGIGAPHYQERPSFWLYEDRLKQGLENIYGADHFIDAGPLTDSYRMHAGGKSAQAFAKRLFQALTGEETT